jgi:hypothetical protein
MLCVPVPVWRWEQDACGKVHGTTLLRIAALDRLAPVALGGILIVAAILRTLWLSQNGYGRLYYAAGVRSMLASWHNFFFNAFDPAGFVSLHKPPIALWLQVASAKLVGF